MLQSIHSSMFSTTRMQSAAPVRTANKGPSLPVRCLLRSDASNRGKNPIARRSWRSAFQAVSAASRAQLPLPAIASQRSSIASRAANSKTQLISSDGISADAIPLQVTRKNFTSVLPAIRAALQDCQFFSFDCEMSGLFLQGQTDHVVDDVGDRYIKAAAAAEQFLVLQFGLSLFKWTGRGYEARSFNFHLFPSPYEDMDLRFMSQASSMAFLASQGFDFNKMVYEGVHYLPLSWRDKQLKASAEALKAAAVPPTLDELDEDEACFMDHLDATISHWLASSSSSTGDVAAVDGSSSSGGMLYLPAPPPQLQKLQRRLLAAGIGSSRWRGYSSSSSSGGSSSSEEKLYIVLHQDPYGSTVLQKATAAEVKAAAESHVTHRAEEVSAATGFSQIFELLRDSSKPAVGHNIRFDLAYCLAAFVQNPLPKTWSGYKTLVGQWFPGGIFDTKYLAHCLPSRSSSSSVRLLNDTALGALYGLMSQGNPACPSPLGSSSSGSSSMTHNVTAWLAEQTLNLDDPVTWQTLPPITHAPGCEAYAAAAAAAAAPDSSSSSGGGSSSSSLAHEAGYDAFMTGVLFVGLLRLFEIDGLCQQNKWQLPQSPNEPCCVQAVQQYTWRQYHAKGKDILYAALQGPEAVPQRPEVVYLTGFPPNTRWHQIQRKLASLGLGTPPVSFVKAQGFSAAPTGAYVIMPSAKLATKAIQVIRADKKWKVQAMPYIDYWYSQHGKNGTTGNTAIRPPPVAVQAVQSGDEQSGSTGGTGSTAAVLQELQHKTAVALQRKADEEQLKEQYKDWVDQFDSQQQQQQQQQQQPEDGSSSSSDAMLAERQQRLQQLQKAAAAARPLPVEAAALLKRPPIPPKRPGQ